MSCIGIIRSQSKGAYSVPSNSALNPTWLDKTMCYDFGYGVCHLHILSKRRNYKPADTDHFSRRRETKL
uniref:Uncharacterized protein n=1 Tax=Physcomitrium patens TaxID=3218 RepID=A0A2K1K098_PHYPA|nr:hypothetical protein PHYPA_014323 [Physcomitrium patens]